MLSRHIWFPESMLDSESAIIHCPPLMKILACLIYIPFPLSGKPFVSKNAAKTRIRDSNQLRTSDGRNMLSSTNSKVLQPKKVGLSQYNRYIYESPPLPLFHLFSFCWKPATQEIIVLKYGPAELSSVQSFFLHLEFLQPSLIYYSYHTR